MATDATGTPTALGIPKYNVNVDAPSGLGFNATMDVLDTLITTANKTPVKKAGTTIGTRRGINFIEGPNVTLTVADDAANDEVDVTVSTSSGATLDYAQRTTDASVTNTGAAPDPVITGAAVTYDGTPVWVEFGAALVERGNTYTRVVVFEDATLKGIVLVSYTSMGGVGRVKITPSPGIRTFSIRAYVDAGTGVIRADTGVGNTYVPAYMRVTRA